MTDGGLLAAVERVAGGLRRRGVEVGTAELIDAAAALGEVDLLERAEVRAALACTMVRHAHQLVAFAEVFDRWFPARPTRALRDGSDDGGPAGTVPPTATAGVTGEALLDAVQGGDERELRLLAEQAVAEHGGFEGGGRTERYHVYRVLRAVDLAALLATSMRRARAAGEAVDRRELAASIEALRRLITEVVRAELALLETEDGIGATADPFDVELVKATASELEEMRRAVRPLARRLAARLRRRGLTQRRGRVDMRQTIRRSLGTGGVPLDVCYRRPQAHRPEVFVLCDVSGSVADFAGFTLTFLSALAGELSRTRCFAFVDAVDEITTLVEQSPDVVEPWRLLQHGRVIGDDGHSDYGAVLAGFWQRYGRVGLSDRSTVIITGDARNNYRPERDELLGEIAARARAVYWLNPEPRSEWNGTDSVIARYARHCDRVFEVRTLRQLEAAVGEIL